MKAVSVPWEERSFSSISIFFVNFLLFEKIYPPEVKWLSKSRAFAFSNGEFFFFLHLSSVSLHEMVLKITFPAFASQEDSLVKVI